IAIGRRAQGYPLRRRTTPPRAHRSDVHGHRTVQTGGDAPGREGPRRRLLGPRTRSVPPDAERTRATRTPTTVRDVRSEQERVQDPLLLTHQER
ncbi:IS200/IS605 family accessory protein TnpB-related protein, partial [Streptomyces hirsutus]